jgi:hypothetical protein
VLCQLSYSHRHADYTTLSPCQERFPKLSLLKLLRKDSERSGGRRANAQSLFGQEVTPHGTQHLSKGGKRQAKQEERDAIEDTGKKIA